MRALDVRAFDLSEFQEIDRQRKSYVYIVIVGIAIISIEVAVIVVPRAAAIAQRGLTTVAGQVLLIGLGIAVVCVCVAAFTVPTYAPGATRVEITSRGIKILYPHGKSHQMLWTGPRTRLSVVDYSTSSGMVRRGLAHHLHVPYVRGSWMFNRRSVLTGEAFEAILASAKGGGAEILTRHGSAAWSGHAPLIYQIRGSRTAGNAARP